VLLEGVGEVLDPILAPLLDLRTVKTARGLTLLFGDNLLDYSPDFQLFLTTKLASPHYLPEVSTRVTLTNFVITVEGLTDQLLDLILRKENAALDEERQQLIQTTYANKLAQRDIEQRILDVLRTTQGNILDDEKAIDALAQSQRLALEIKHKQEVAAGTQAKLDSARKEYAPVASVCSLLFFLVSKLMQVDVMYQYSLSWYLALFHRSLSEFRGPPPELDEEETEVPIQELAPHFAYALYSNVCRSLFEKDKLLFSFMLTAKLAQANGELSQSEFLMLVKTQTSLDAAGSGTYGTGPAWLPEARWATLCHMASTSPALQAVVQSFSAHSRQWRDFVKSEGP
jgi:dynein heavy chain, axonemal